jgi:hypothetical protein
MAELIHASLTGIMRVVDRATKWGMVVVLLLAAVLRLWMLPAYPLGLHYDEAANVILTRQIAEEGYRPLFIRPYTGKEVLFFYASAPWVKLTGGQTWGVRLSAAMLGILTVAVSYAMTRALLGSEQSPRTALYAAAGMAVAFPHLVLSRYGFRAITQPLLQGLVVTAIWRGLRTKKLSWLIAGGVLTGLTGYTYLAARLFPVPLAIALGVLWLQSPRHQLPQLRRSIALVLVCSLVTFAPLGLFFLLNPGTFSTRITQVATTSLPDALQGIWACLKALMLPGQGDPYVRFNLPGRPLMDGFSALLACVGWVVLLRARYTRNLTRAGRVLVLTATAVMLLPSALATTEITPSNLRMVGMFPFLVLLPAVGLSWLSRVLPGKSFHSPVIALLFVVLGSVSGSAYARWAQSPALFYAADGEMVLAAQAVDKEVGAGTTVFVASEHYKHPTVAALSTHFHQVKWLTGGASFVLPAEGDVVSIVPQSAQPPLPWPDFINDYITERRLLTPDGSTAAVVQHLAEEDAAVIKDMLVDSPGEPLADFAHITSVYELTPLQTCENGAPCTVFLIWETLSPYTALQPMVRIHHPTTGEWARAMPFHYPAEEWTPGDIVLDQIQLRLPPGIPPGQNYQLAVSMVDGESQQLLPRLVKEQFAGLEVSTPVSPDTPWPMRSDAPLTEQQLTNACGWTSWGAPQDLENLRLLRWTLPTKSTNDTIIQVKPGELLLVTLCWEVLKKAGAYASIEFVLQASGGDQVLYAGSPAGGYGFASWSPGTVVEDRYALRLPRELITGPRSLQVRVNGEAEKAEIIDLIQLEVLSVSRTYALPHADVEVDALFGGALRLWGYDQIAHPDSESIDITLYWQPVKVLEQDFVVFIHLFDTVSGEIVGQVDEQPLHGERGTSTWIEREVIADTHTLHVPGGRYAMRLGLYLPLSGTYMTIDGARELVLDLEIAQP